MFSVRANLFLPVILYSSHGISATPGFSLFNTSLSFGYQLHLLNDYQHSQCTAFAIRHKSATTIRAESFEFNTSSRTNLRLYFGQGLRSRSAVIGISIAGNMANPNYNAHAVRRRIVKAAQDGMSALLERYSSVWKRDRVRIELFYQVYVTDGTCKFQDGFFELQPEFGNDEVFYSEIWASPNPSNTYMPVLTINGMLDSGIYFSPTFRVYGGHSVYNYPTDILLRRWRPPLRAYVNLPRYAPRQRYFCEPGQTGRRLVSRSRNDIRVPVGWIEVFPIDYRIAQNRYSLNMASNTWVANFPHECSSSYIDLAILLGTLLSHGPCSEFRKLQPGPYCGGYGGLSKLPAELQLQIIESLPRPIDIHCALQQQFPYLAQEYIRTIFDRWKKWLRKLCSRENLRYLGTRPIVTGEGTRWGAMVDVYRLTSYDKHPSFKITSKDFQSHLPDLARTVPDLMRAEFKLALAFERFFWLFHVSGRPSPEAPRLQSSMAPTNLGSGPRLRAHATALGAMWSGTIIEGVLGENPRQTISEIPIKHLAIDIDTLRLRPLKETEAENLTEEQKRERKRANIVAVVFIFYDELVAICEDMEFFLRPEMAQVNHLLHTASTAEVLLGLPVRFREGELSGYSSNSDYLFATCATQREFEESERIFGYAAEMWKALEAH